MPKSLNKPLDLSSFIEHFAENQLDLSPFLESKYIIMAMLGLQSSDQFDDIKEQ